MNLSALAQSMALGQVGTSGALSIEKPHPKVTCLKTYDGKISIIRFQEGDAVYIYIANTFKIDAVFGNYTRSTKTYAFLETLKAAALTLGATVKDESIGGFNSWYGERTWDRMLPVFLSRMGFDAQMYIRDQSYIDANARSALLSQFPARVLLKDDAGNYLTATPLEQCGHCKSLARFGSLEDRTITVMSEGIPLVKADGSPIQERVKTCEKCEKPKILKHNRGAHEKPIEVEGHARWPFERKVGIELEALAIAPLPDLTDLKWRIVNDSSISGFNFEGESVEFNTPPAEGDAFYSRALAGIRRVQPFVRVNKSCGFHVHIDVQDIFPDSAKLANVQNLLIAFQPLMFALQPPSRRGSTYCKLWPAYTRIDEPMYDSDKFMAVSWYHIRPPTFNLRGEKIGGGYGTIEFRMGAGTRNPRKVLLFVQFLQRLIEIGSRVKDENAWMSLRDKTSWALFETFKELAAAHDQAVERNPEFLRDLLAWMEMRIEKFSPKLPLAVKAFTFKFDKKFEASEFSIVEDLDERFEEGQGIA